MLKKNEDQLFILCKIPGIRKPKDENHEPLSFILRKAEGHERWQAWREKNVDKLLDQAHHGVIELSKKYEHISCSDS